MSNPRSASNAWAKIKGKLATADANGVDGENGANGAVTASPKKAKGTPKKKAPTGPSKVSECLCLPPGLGREVCAAQCPLTHL